MHRRRKCPDPWSDSLLGRSQMRRSMRKDQNPCCLLEKLISMCLWERMNQRLTSDRKEEDEKDVDIVGV